MLKPFTGLDSLENLNGEQLNPGRVNYEVAWEAIRRGHHVTLQNRSLRGTYQRFYTALNADWEKKAFERSKVVVAVSEKVAQELMVMGVPRDRIRVILNGIDLQEFALTVIAMAHRLSTIAQADKVVVLEQGPIVEQGNYSNFQVHGVRLQGFVNHFGKCLGVSCLAFKLGVSEAETLDWLR